MTHPDVETEIQRQFDEEVRGWLSTDCFLELTEIIERSGEWIRTHGGVDLLNDRQRATVRMMIERQFALAMRARHPLSEVEL